MLHQDRAFIVTGAGRGIGFAVAHALSQQGANLLLNDFGTTTDGLSPDPKVIEHAANLLRKQGCAAVIDSSDSSTPQAAERLVDRCLEHFGRIDGVVCCAGIQQLVSVAHSEVSAIERIYRVNALGPMLLTRLAARCMMERKVGGSIVICTSTTGQFGAARQSLHAAADAAIVGFVRSAALDLRRYQIRINALAPTARTRLTENTPVIRAMKDDSLGPQNPAEMVSCLLSEAAQSISGETIGVAGDRVYTIGTHQSTGWFADGRGLDTDSLIEAWGQIST